MYTDPTIADFKLYFVRDFPYTTDVTTGVTDGDIQKGLNDAKDIINSDLFDTQQAYTTGFLLLSAHFMVEAIQMGSSGASGKFEWLTASKAVGSVSVSYAIPQSILDNKYFAFLTTTKYGAKYLEKISPFLIGNVFTVCGATTP